uniref:Protein RER1 n=1 Tax=Pavo cristatus TaxID=9049 RepID=A0A8C9EHU2_PAVCR
MSEGDSIGESVHGKPSVVYRFFTRLGQIYQSWLDKSTPYTAVRWIVTLGLSFIYMIRVYLLQNRFLLIHRCIAVQYSVGLAVFKYILWMTSGQLCNSVGDSQLPKARQV